MLKIKNKFIIFIITTIFVIVITLLNKSLNENKKDLDSYVVLIEWQAQLNNDYLNIQKKYKLSVWDTIKTIWNKALAVLEWWDGSVTRLWWNTSLKINELLVKKDLSKININFKLLNWRTWSNVVSFFWQWSYFRENFRDYAAAIRWTTFDIDLDKDYLYVTNHKVDLVTGSWNLIEVNQHSPINLKNLSLISLQDFIKSFKDNSWNQLNQNFDNELLKTMKIRLNKDIENIAKYKNLDLKNVLTDEIKKQELYNTLLTQYQKLNFTKPSDWELFKLKLDIKSSLLQLSDDPSNKEILVNSTMYDFKDILDSKNYENLDQLLLILSRNKDSLKNLNLNYYFKDSVIPSVIKNKIIDNFSELKDFFTSNFNTFNKIDVTIEDVTNIKEKADWLIHQWLDTLFDK